MPQLANRIIPFQQYGQEVQEDAEMESDIRTLEGLFTGVGFNKEQSPDVSDNSIDPNDTLEALNQPRCNSTRDLRVLGR